MTDSPTRNPFASSVVLRVPGTETVDVTRDRPWGRAGRLFDLYRPPDAPGPLPAVVLVTGFADPGFRAVAGCAFKDTAPFSSWARLLAASGLAAITYSNADPAADAPAVLAYLRDHADELGIDAGRFGLWACSGHAQRAGRAQPHAESRRSVCGRPVTATCSTSRGRRTVDAGPTIQVRRP